MKKFAIALASICIITFLMSTYTYSSAALAAQKTQAVATTFQTNTVQKVANDSRPQSRKTGHRRRPSFKVNQPITHNVLSAQDVFNAIDANDAQSVHHILLDTVIDPDSIDVFGTSFLQRAIDKDNFLIVKTLLRFGATPIDVPKNMAQKNTALIKNILNEYILLRTRAK